MNQDSARTAFGYVCNTCSAFISLKLVLACVFPVWSSCCLVALKNSVVVDVKAHSVRPRLARGFPPRPILRHESGLDGWVQTQHKNVILVRRLVCARISNCESWANPKNIITILSYGIKTSRPPVVLFEDLQTVLCSSLNYTIWKKVFKMLMEKNEFRMTRIGSSFLSPTPKTNIRSQQIRPKIHGAVV